MSDSLHKRIPNLEINNPRCPHNIPACVRCVAMRGRVKCKISARQSRKWLVDCFVYIKSLKTKCKTARPIELNHSLQGTALCTQTASQLNRRTAPQDRRTAGVHRRTAPPGPRYIGAENDTSAAAATQECPRRWDVNKQTHVATIRRDDAPSTML